MTDTDFEDSYSAQVYLPACPSCAQRYRAERELRLVELRSEMMDGDR